jgi:ferric-dicitrate binding protein FerR (iron transport regulator)
MNDLERLLRLAGRRPEPSAEGRARARIAVHDAWEAAVSTRTRRRWTLVAWPVLAAAAVLIAFAQPWRRPGPAVAIDVGTIAVGGLQIDAHEGRAGDVLKSGTTLHTPEGRVAAVTLVGGARVRLNAGTTVRLIGLRRLRLERGQVYVDAGRNEGPDLTIETSAGELRDIGTRFDVSSDGQGVRVRVRDGIVRLTARGRDRDVRAGQEMRAGTNGEVVIGGAVTHGPDWDWILKGAPFAIDGATLEAFLRWVETEGGLVVEFADPALRDRVRSTVLNGSIATLGLEDALAVILPASGLSYRILGDRLVITKAGTAP